MGEFSVGDRVLVPGVVKHVYPNSVVLVRQWGAENEFFDVDLRPDTGGRDLTVQDLRDAYKAWNDQHPGWGDVRERERFIPEYLTRIARGDAGSAGDDTAPPAEGDHDETRPLDEQRLDAWATEDGIELREKWRLDDGVLRARSATGWVYTVHDQEIIGIRGAAGPRAGDTAPDDELPGADDVEREAQQYAADCEGYEVEVAAAWRDGYNAAEERWIAAANESARLDVLDNDRLRSEVAALRDAGNALADSVSRFLMSPEDHDDRAKMQNAARAWRSAAGEATT